MQTHFMGDLCQGTQYMKNMTFAGFSLKYDALL